MEVGIMARKTGPKPSAEGPRASLIAMKCRQPYKEWVNKFAENERINPASLIDLALMEYAKLKGFKAPPKR